MQLEEASGPSWVGAAAVAVAVVREVKVERVARAGVAVGARAGALSAVEGRVLLGWALAAMGQVVAPAAAVGIQVGMAGVARAVATPQIGEAPTEVAAAVKAVRVRGRAGEA